jgi:hypothetical protein
VVHVLPEVAVGGAPRRTPPGGSWFAPLPIPGRRLDVTHE